MCKRIPWLPRVSSLLAAISIGKHNQGLYFHGRRHYSTALGGLVTIVIVFLMVLFTISTFKSIFWLDEYLITYNLRTLTKDAFEREFSLYDFDITSFSKSIYIQLDPNYHTSCAEVEFLVTLNFTGKERYSIVQPFQLDSTQLNPLGCEFIPEPDPEMDSLYKQWLRKY